MARVLELTYRSPAIDADGNSRSLIMQVVRRTLGLAFASIGAFVVVVMTYAASFEVRGEGDFYALMVSCLVVVFGVLLTRDGVYLATGYRLQTCAEGDVRAPDHR